MSEEILFWTRFNNAVAGFCRETATDHTKVNGLFRMIAGDGQDSFVFVLSADFFLLEFNWCDSSIVTYLMKKYLTSQQRIEFLQENSLALEASLERETIITANLKDKIKESKKLADDSEWRYQEHIARLTSNLEKVVLESGTHSFADACGRKSDRNDRRPLKSLTKKLSCDKENCENGT
jgi:hypothetical protein